MDQRELVEQIFLHQSKAFTAFPDKASAQQFIQRLFDFLFLPGSVRDKQPRDLEAELESLRGQLCRLVDSVLTDKEAAEVASQTFFHAIPRIYANLMKDARSIVEFDPAAESLEEVVVAYPGFYATAVYRLSHQLHRQGVKIIPRIFTECAHSQTGIDIHPGAVIGESFFIDHGTGIVVGETTEIGNNVKLYQGVTLGALNVSKAKANAKRHPTIGDNVIIYSGATILGGETVVGHDSVIGGNVWLTQSVPPHSIVYHKSEVAIKDKFPVTDVLNFVI